jgi:hypothetical protein
MTKKKLKHKKAFKRALADLDEGEYVTTSKEVLKWFHLLNKSVFDNKVPSVDINVRPIKFQGWCEYIDYDPAFRITLRTRYRSEKHLMQAIAHEMVHVIQYVNTDDMNHGPYFQMWKKHFKTLNIKL